jgi:hypothetical protein
MNPIFMIGLAPLSWRFSVTRRKPGKLVLAFGPLRAAWHNPGRAS